MNATSHLFGAQLVSPKRLYVKFYYHLQNRNPFRGPRRSIQHCFGAVHLSAIQGSDPTRLHSYKQPFSDSQMLQLHCCKVGGGFKSKELKASVVKSELSEVQSVIIFPTYHDYSLNAETVVSLHIKDVPSV